MSQYSNNNKPSTNSYGHSWTNKGKLKKLKTMVWDNLYQIQICDMEESQGFPREIRDSGVKLSLSAASVSSLLSVVDDILSDIKESNKSGEFNFESDSVFFGTTTQNAIQITDGSDIGQDKGLYVVLYKNVDANKNPEKMEIFEIEPKSSIKGFRPGDKSSGKLNKRYTQGLKELRNTLREFEKHSAKMSSHFNKLANRNEVTKGLHLLASLAAANGITAADAYNNSGGNANTFSNNSPTSGGNESFSFSHGDYAASPVLS